MLLEEYRGEMLENVHDGRICAVDASGRVIGSYGDVEALTFLRSAAKPFQLIPLMVRELDKKYGLTDAEIAVCAASHTGQDIHVASLESIMQKADLREEELIMLPTLPIDNEAKTRCIKSDGRERKLFHNCAGKHLALMMLARSLGDKTKDYWQVGSKTQTEILQAIASVTDFDKDRIRIGVDGCGVPVFAVPLKNIALSYLRLATPSLAKNSDIACALERIATSIEHCPDLIRGKGHLCSEINSHPDLVGKIGAEGVYGLGIKSLSYGVAVKVLDGTTQTLPIILAEILKQLGYADHTIYETLYIQKSPTKYNDNKDKIGFYKPTFVL